MSYNIIAVQKFQLNLYIATLYCPRSCLYTLVFLKEGRARTSIYINKQIPPSKWHTGLEPDYSWVRLNLKTGPLTIYNIYNETSKSYETTVWNSLILYVLKAVQAPSRHLIVGDFNFYYTHQGGDRVRQSHIGAIQVVESLRTGLVDLLLELGTVTREKHKNELSTLDLAFSTLNLTL